MAAAEKAGYIEHPGIVRDTDDRSVIVTITSQTACSGCHAEGSCGISGKEEKIIEVSGHYNVSPGDRVVVIMKRTMGYAAIIYGYFIPALLFVAALVTLASFSVGELATGLSALGIMAFYYFALYLFRERLNSKFTFSIKSL